ncbi:mannitol dehydrogenase family protein [Rheinheimera tilapiae]|uniref:Mannitol dehydrogenase family protein n=1 Tax=Rheinheimera tilapiae TaxID=875043 RepID=A0ABV6BFT3_9GAMM
MTLPRLSVALFSETNLSNTNFSQTHRVGPLLPWRQRQAAVTPRIVHLGIGAFHRAHLAWYTDALMQAGGGDDPWPWAIMGVSLRSPEVAAQLNPQQGLYTLQQSSASSTSQQVIQSVLGVLVAPQDPAAVIALLGAPTTEIISLTVTEKGYCLDLVSRQLDFAHPDIVFDLAHPSTPRSTIGYLVAGLAERFEKGYPAPTILCCDNLPQNGVTLARLVTQFAEKLNPELAGWITSQVAFPSSMVDRIVPATTQADIEVLAAETGYMDLAMVKTEQFSQWVIEDKFAGARPAWEQVGALLVQDVTPFEHAKLRLLNGAHSALAYLGTLAGYSYVHQVVADPLFGRYLRHLMTQELMPTLLVDGQAPAGLDLPRYIDALLQRFANPALAHRTMQIAMDGSQKLPQRLLAAAQQRLQAGLPVDAICFAVAGWLRFSMGFDAKGDALEVSDPLAARLLEIRLVHWDHIDELVGEYLKLSQVFAPALVAYPQFAERLTYWLSYILANGVPTALQSLLLEVQDYAAAPRLAGSAK